MKIPVKPSPKAFALVVSLTMLVLLTIIAVGLLSLSAITLRTTSQTMAQYEAQANARMALMVAIGELQREMGPDQRISATASILGDQVQQSHLTGVWRGWKWDGEGSPPNYEARKREDFVRWLISSRRSEDTESLAFVDSTPSGDIAMLVQGSQAAEDQVEASIIPITTPAAQRIGGYAWAVFDESSKLPVDLPGAPDDVPASTLLSHMASAPLPGYAAPENRSWQAIGEAGGTRAKLLTTEQTGLIGVEVGDRGFHELTTRGRGVIADVAEGGLAMDLSRLFDENSLPTEFSQRYLYSDTTTPLVSAPRRFAGANPIPDPDPSWRLLHSHYRMFHNLPASRGGTALSVTTMPRPPAGTPYRNFRNDPFFHGQQIAPVIAKAQFVFSLTFVPNQQTLNHSAQPNNNSLPDSRRDKWVGFLIIDPVITLWNPYSVPIRLPAARVDLYRVPLSYRIYKNGILINEEYAHMANTYWDYHMAGRNDFYRLNLLPPTGQSEILMEPGEHIVFTAVNSAGHAALGSLENTGLTLRPGFTPPAGNATQPGAGGITTLNLMRNSEGQPIGRDYGKNVYNIAVKENDIVEFDVKAMVRDARSSATGDRDISGFLKYYVGPVNDARLVGGIEIDYDSALEDILPEYTRRDLPRIRVRRDMPTAGGQNAIGFKEPFMITSFQLKTERDSIFPSRGWLHNAPTNLYASAGLDDDAPWTAQQYELRWEPMLDWPPASPTIEISNTGNRGYGGSGVYAQSGVEFATFASVPISPMLSLGQFRHAPINHGGQAPLTTQVVANSHASPLIPANQIRDGSGVYNLLDHSFLANNALFDRAFFSSLANPGGPQARNWPSLSEAITEFYDQGRPLPNLRLAPYRGNRTTEQISQLLTGQDGYRSAAAHMMIDSPFNVNTTRVEVWEAILASHFGEEVAINNGGVLDISPGQGAAVSRHIPAQGNAYEGSNGAAERELAKWNGYRRLNQTQIRRLAEEIVVEIKARGPFQSISEFVNRRPENGALGRAGALQAAIDRSGINDELLEGANRTTQTPADNPVPIPQMAHPEALVGNTGDGAPGILSQADILTSITPILTARGDTFRIRAYGEAGAGGSVTARAWCEAVVQRVPDYLDRADEAWDEPTSPVNLRFGRRYEIISFRWLNPEEI